jgi:hypothetical protein
VANKFQVRFAVVWGPVLSTDQMISWSLLFLMEKNPQSLMLSTFCSWVEDWTWYLSVCNPSLYQVRYPAHPWQKLRHCFGVGLSWVVKSGVLACSESRMFKLQWWPWMSWLFIVACCWWRFLLG